MRAYAHTHVHTNTCTLPLAHFEALHFLEMKTGGSLGLLGWGLTLRRVQGGDGTLCTGPALELQLCLRALLAPTGRPGVGGGHRRCAGESAEGLRAGQRQWLPQMPLPRAERVWGGRAWLSPEGRWLVPGTCQWARKGSVVRGLVSSHVASHWGSLALCPQGGWCHLRGHWEVIFAKC